MSQGVFKHKGQPGGINAAHSLHWTEKPDINPEGNVALPVPNEIWSFKMAALNDTL